MDVGEAWTLDSDDELSCYGDDIGSNINIDDGAASASTNDLVTLQVDRKSSTGSQVLHCLLSYFLHAIWILHYKFQNTRIIQISYFSRYPQILWTAQKSLFPSISMSILSNLYWIYIKNIERFQCLKFNQRKTRNKLQIEMAVLYDLFIHSL